ncbi:class I SAM-dependent methyltransferase [Streptomyces sp. NPDC005070]
MADESGFQLKGSGPERYERYAAPFMAPFVEAILDAVDLYPGAKVLDLACGTGFAARAAAARVGPAGRVSGADVNAGMIGMAVERAPRMYPDIRFTVAPAEALPYEDAAFDAVVCQQGVQFFPDLHAAFAEAARVTCPDGRFAATAWAARDLIPYFVAQYEAVEEYGGKGLAADYEGAFSGTPERLSALPAPRRVRPRPALVHILGAGDRRHRGRGSTPARRPCGPHPARRPHRPRRRRHPPLHRQPADRHPLRPAPRTRNGRHHVTP